MMDEERLKAIEARAARSMSGPWQAEEGGSLAWMLEQAPTAADSPGWIADFGHGLTAEVEFIAHARTDIPDLCTELRRLDSQLNLLGNCLYRLLDLKDEHEAREAHAARAKRDKGWAWDKAREALAECGFRATDKETT